MEEGGGGRRRGREKGDRHYLGYCGGGVRWEEQRNEEDWLWSFLGREERERGEVEREQGMITRKKGGRRREEGERKDRKENVI